MEYNTTTSVHYHQQRNLPSPLQARKERLFKLFSILFKQFRKYFFCIVLSSFCKTSPTIRIKFVRQKNYFLDSIQSIKIMILRNSIERIEAAIINGASYFLISFHQTNNLRNTMKEFAKKVIPLYN